MEKQVIYRDRQELQADDLQNQQSWTDEALRHVVMDAVTPERQFSGLVVTSHSATELEVGPGRLVDGTSGRIYAVDTAQIHSLFAQLPLQDQKWLSVSVFGQEEEINLEPRDYLIDLQTREVEPQVVAMQRRRVAVVHIAQGLESPTPERPEPPTGYTLIAQVRISPTGIQEVVLADSRRLPNLHAVNQRLLTAEGWIRGAEPRLATMMSDMAGLRHDLGERATMAQAIDLGIDMARVKERLRMPDTFVFYGGDHFLDESQSDLAHAGYSALASEGVRMPAAAAATGTLALLNPIDAAVSVTADGFLLPAYDEVCRLRMESRSGELTVNQYQYNTYDLVQKHLTRTRIRYGGSLTVCTNGAWWKSGRYDPASGIFRIGAETWEVPAEDRAAAIQDHKIIRVTQFWIDSWEEPYWDWVTTLHSIQGSCLAQTFLSAQSGWMTSAELYLTGVAASGQLTLVLTEATLGQPDLTQVLAKETLQPSALTGGWNRIPWSRPVFIRAGKRYALAILSGGAHRVGTTLGTEYTQGLLMYSQDSAYFQEASDRDLMLRLNFAQFRTPRAIVSLQPLQLAGGIHALDLIFDGYTPVGAGLYFEYQVGGVWYPVQGGAAYGLASAPALIPLRMVLLGTLDLMPALVLPTSVAKVQRWGTAFQHWSTTRTLSTASTSIKVRALLEGFNPAKHTFAAKLEVGGSVVNATSTVTTLVDEATGARWVDSNFTLGTATTAYKVRLDGTTTDAQDGFHVAERYDLAL